MFARYAGGNNNESSRQQVETVRSGQETTTQKRFVTEVSQVSYADRFKKMKYNQMETLKELRQEYEILRGLPLQDEFLGHSHLKKQASDYSSSRHEPESVSSSSKQTDRRHKKQRDSSAGRRDSREHNHQAMALEKRQLELVIGNSMRKIE